MRRLTTAVVSLLVAAACGGSPTGPAAGGAATALTSRLEGTWEIEYKVTQCSGERHCVLFTGTTRTITVRLVRSGSGHEGVVTLGNYDNVSVSGTVAADGSLEMRGIRQAAGPNDVETEINRLYLRPTVDGIEGTFQYTKRGTPSPWLFGQATTSGEFVRATRRADPPSMAFTGTWRGHAAVRDCTYSGWLWCYPHRPEDGHVVELTLEQVGMRTTGSMRVSGSTVITLDGTVSGNSVVFQGSTPDTGHSGVVLITTLRPTTLQLDQLGRLTGALDFEIQFDWHDPAMPTYTTDYRRMDLVTVARLPS